MNISREERKVLTTKYKFFVCSTDKFMSGWGRAEGKINKCMVPAKSYIQAKHIEEYVKTREEQKYININLNAPYDTKYKLISIVWGWRNLTAQMLKKKRY